MFSIRPCISRPEDRSYVCSLNVQQGTKIKHPGKNRHLHPLTSIVSGVLILAAVLYALHLWQAESNAKEARSQFHVDARRHADAIHISLNRHLNTLYTLGGFYNHAEQISREEFHIFTRSLLKNSPNIQALEWIPVVTAAERNQFEEEAGTSIPGFQFKELNENGDLVTASSRNTYCPVYFVEPYAGNEVAAGFDLASEEVRRNTLKKARDSAQITSSGYIKLVQDTGHQNALLSFMPIYHYATDTTDVPLRRQHIKGFVLAIGRIGDMFREAIARVAIQEIDVWVVDVTAGEQQHLIFAHTMRSPGGPPRYPPSQGLRFEHNINLSGNQLKVIAAPAPTSVASFQAVKYLAWKLLFIGMLITGIIAWKLNKFRKYAFHLATSNKALDHAIARLRNNKEILRVSEEKLHHALESAELERSRLEDAIESIDSAIAIFDADERMVTSNSEFRNTYYEITEKIVPGVRFKTLLEEYFSAANLDSLTNAPFNEWVDKWLGNFRQHKSGEIQRVHDRWLVISDYPTSEGGVVSLRYDITSIKKAEKQIRSLNRTHAVLSRSSSSLSSAYDEEDLLGAFCSNAVEIGGYSIAWIIYAQPDNSGQIELMAIAGDMDRESAISSLVCIESDCSNPCSSQIAIDTREISVMHDLQKKPHLDTCIQSPIRQKCKSMIALPIRVDEKVLGSFTIFSSEKRAFNNDEVSLLEELVTNLSHGIKTMRTRAASEQRMRQIKNEVEQNERKRIAETLHDGVAQTMQAVNLNLKSVRTMISSEQKEAANSLNQIIDNIGSVIEDLRSISHDLRPLFLERMDLGEAVRHHCNELSQHSKVGILVTIDNQNFQLDELNKEQCFLSFREAINNALRHAEATRIDVIIEGLSPDLFSIQIRDNGVGFNTDHKFHLPSGLGLSMISERIQSIGGHAEIHSSPGKGTIVTLITPGKS